MTPISTATSKAGTTITVDGRFPDYIAITPDGSTAYVSNLYADTVTPINTSTNTPGRAITVGNSPGAIAITPDGSTAYVPNTGSGTVTPVNTATGAPGTAITVGADPSAIAITP